MLKTVNRSPDLPSLFALTSSNRRSSRLQSFLNMGSDLSCPNPLQFDTTNQDDVAPVKRNNLTAPSDLSRDELVQQPVFQPVPRAAGLDREDFLEKTIHTISSTYRKEIASKESEILRLRQLLESLANANGALPNIPCMDDVNEFTDGNICKSAYLDTESVSSGSQTPTSDRAYKDCQQTSASQQDSPAVVSAVPQHTETETWELV